MSKYPSIKNVKLTNTAINKLKTYFKWSSFTEGKTITNITPQGGIHYTGKKTITNAVFLEIKRKRIYVVISLYEYPKGVVFHVYFPYPKVTEYSKIELETNIIEPLYLKITEILTNNQ